MAIAAEHDEILLAVRAGLASSNHVVNLELIAPTTVLASPAVTFQDAPF